MRNNPNLILILGSAMLILSACNLPRATQTPAPNSFLTVAAQTVQAQLTLDALLTPQATQTPSPSETPAPPTVTNTPPNTASPTPICDLAQFIADVTVPDGTVFQPGETFTKTWRFKNNGVCTWTSGYQLIFDSGDSMNGPATQALAGSVAPGQTVDISVTLKAPATAGTYRGYWKLRNSAGVLLPVSNGFQGTSFFIEIKVVPPSATPTITPSVTPSPTTGPIIIITLLPIITIPPIILTP
ncbi:MAG: hypothetical protein Fur0016_09620 [Anaerolineales bacterium]